MIHVDASEASAGAFFAQSKDEYLVIIAYRSPRFNDGQRHHSAALKGCYAVVISIQHRRPFLCGRHFVCDRLRGTKVPLVSAGYIEHINTMGDRIIVLRLHRAKQAW